MRKALAVVGLGILSVTLLTGCGGSTQTTAEACDIAEKRLTETSQGVAEQLGNMGDTDFADAAEAIAKMHDEVVDTANSITHTEIHDALIAMADGLTDLGEMLGKAADAGDDAAKLTELNEEYARIQTAMSEPAATLEELCGS